MKRKAAKFEKPWTPFEPATLPDSAHDLLENVGGRSPDGIAVNSRYEVWIYKLEPLSDDLPPMVHLSIKRRDRDPVRRWRDLQRIKNEIVGIDVEACEIFPTESRLVDTSNQYHLWCLPAGVKFPFGYRERLVMEGDGNKSRQEPFEEGERPADTVTAPKSDDDIAAMANKMKAESECGAHASKVDSSAEGSCNFCSNRSPEQVWMIRGEGTLTVRFCSRCLKNVSFGGPNSRR